MAIDPNNATANSYMDKLKSYFLKEVYVERIMQSLETNPADTKEASSLKLPEKEIMESITKDKKSANLLQQAELDAKIKEIITQQEIEEEKSRVLTFGPGDIVMISVRDHPELSGRSGVRLTGDLVLPLVNTAVPATGLTLEELTEGVTEAMKRYVKEPVVTVTVEEYRSKVYYVIDENVATAYPITRANLTLRDALFVSDWGADRALGRVLLIKPYKLHPIVKKIDAYDIIYRGNLLNDVKIENGDVIYVPKTYFRRTTDYFTAIFEPINEVSGQTQRTQDDVKHFNALGKFWYGTSFSPHANDSNNQ